MTEYHATARSNYFRVKDVETFAEALPHGVHLVTREKDDRVALLVRSEDGGWPTSFWDDQIEDAVDISIPGIVSQHMTPGEIAYGLEAGAEKLRYVTGYGWATDGEETIYLNLEDALREKAEETFGIQPATYAEL